jgi:hypothetical protein
MAVTLSKITGGVSEPCNITCPLEEKVLDDYVLESKKQLFLRKLKFAFGLSVDVYNT